MKNRRSERFRSAREFCAKVDVGISYPQYSRYEAGDQLPNLNQALRLCRLLSIPSIEGILEWCLAQIHESAFSQEVDQFLQQVRNGESLPVTRTEGSSKNLNSDPVKLDEFFVFNRSHIKLFGSNPAYRDIFTYINSYGPELIDAEEISGALKMETTEAQEILDGLFHLGVIDEEAGKYRASKKKFYFPDDQEFFSLRNQNFQHNVDRIMDSLEHQKLEEGRAFRAVLTRELTEKQMDHVVGQMNHLLNSVVNLPETSQPNEVYSLCMLLGERFRRAEAQSAETSLTGLTRQDSDRSIDDEQSEEA